MPVGLTHRFQRLLRVTRRALDDYAHEDLEAVAFVPLIGEQGWPDQDLGDVRITTQSVLITRIGVHGYGRQGGSNGAGCSNYAANGRDITSISVIAGAGAFRNGAQDDADHQTLGGGAALMLHCPRVGPDDEWRFDRNIRVLVMGNDSRREVPPRS
jgi:hypothetical protein